MERVALVTGGSRGIGRAIAEELLRRGFRVGVAARQPHEAVEELRDRGLPAFGVPTDLAQDPPQEVVRRTIAQAGSLHVLVHAAGVNVRKPALELSYEEWRRVLYLHLDVAFLLAQAAAPSMVQVGWGRVLFIGSVTTFSGGGPVRIPAYTTAKTALLGLTRALAKEWAPLGIRVNLLCPGYVKTEFTSAVWENPELYGPITSRIPLGRWATPEEIARVGGFLCSEEADYLTGQAVVADGGFLAY
ncbi:MAG: SDR family oxidoreductase [Meiothermus sp.]|uniref:SDR family NAD(P)-dependent oxidoreductase n=1 Tax=Meiothermus sp. TaxID=1955249 RepID=UPI0025EB9A11|nr:SDR family oxidoreductase [Meiothermus sp.]MCS7059286.1 SDR family oxidoreductase [Meiothermus sp.]MCS7195171.1 SDR family oxidoreductase [Meiothermus sp.]MCX7740962.1 SDR family oxidoreductase [Meiothermus sp.]MDW8091702.1 SDR family oxidoreductase [Meiothermus sp.]MDW8482106.1 SDR family oxidoreductase [Meiothermus sp.]